MSKLLELLQAKLLPWSRDNGAERIVVARQTMTRRDVPTWVELNQRKLSGKRVIVKGDRLYGNTRLASAKWPEMGMHEVEAFRFVCVVQGQVNFQAGEYLLGCREGDYILLPPRTPHMGNEHRAELIHSRVPGRSCLLLWIGSYRRGLQCWLSSYGEKHRTGGALNNYLFLNSQLIELFRLLFEEASSAKNTQLCNYLLAAAFTSLNRELEGGSYFHPGPTIKVSEPPVANSDFSLQIEKYIRRHLNQPLTLEQVARGLYMSRAQLARVVRRETGHSFGELHTIYRIQEAKTLLCESEWTVQTIARFIGFKSTAYFCTLFQRQVGRTPSEFRSESRKSSGFLETDTKKK